MIRFGFKKDNKNIFEKIGIRNRQKKDSWIDQPHIEVC